MSQISWNECPPLNGDWACEEIIIFVRVIQYMKVQYVRFRSESKRLLQECVLNRICRTVSWKYLIHFKIAVVRRKGKLYFGIQSTYIKKQRDCRMKTEKLTSI